MGWFAYKKRNPNNAVHVQSAQASSDSSNINKDQKYLATTIEMNKIGDTSLLQSNGIMAPASNNEKLPAKPKHVSLANAELVEGAGNESGAVTGGNHKLIKLASMSQGKRDSFSESSREQLYQEGGNINGVSGTKGSGTGDSNDTGDDIVNIQVNIQNWPKWNEYEVLAWVGKQLTELGLSEKKTNEFLKEFGLMNVTGGILKRWINKCNGDSDSLTQMMQKRIDFNHKSVFWEVVTEAIIQLPNARKDGVNLFQD